MLYEPTSYSPEDLKKHGEMIATRLGLTPNQIRCLVPELRNALASGTMGLENLITFYGRNFTNIDGEDLEDVRRAMLRVVALADALTEKI